MAKKPFRKAKRLPKFKRPPPPALPSALGAVPSAVPGRCSRHLQSGMFVFVLIRTRTM